MPVQLVTLNTHRVNALDLVPYHLMEHQHDHWHGTCHGRVDADYPWLRHSSGDLEQMTFEKFGVGIRHVDWKNNLSLLQHIVDQAEKKSQDLFFGSHSTEQLAFLKDFFGANSLVIALTYGEHNYEYLLEDLAKTHVYLLQSGQIQPNQQDQEAAASKNYSQLVEHYKAVFDHSNYIPRSCVFQGDYEIPFDDYAHMDRMEQHFKNINFPVVDKTTSLYHTWHRQTQQG